MTIAVRIVANGDLSKGIQWPMKLACRPMVSETIQGLRHTYKNGEHSVTTPRAKIVSITHVQDHASEPHLEIEVFNDAFIDRGG